MVTHFAFMFRAITAITHIFRVETTFIFHGLLSKKTHWGFFFRQKNPALEPGPTIRDLQCGCVACLVFEAWRSSAVVGGMVRNWEFIYTNRIHETIAYIPIYTCFRWFLWVDVGKYTIHGSYREYNIYIYICMYTCLHYFVLHLFDQLWFVWLHD